MITPLGKNILLKKKICEQKIIFVSNESNNLYLVVKQGSSVSEQLENKTVFIKEGLSLLEYQNEEYYLAKEDNILAVIEE